MRILEGEGVTKYFGGLAAVSNVDFHADQGEIAGLIGPNLPQNTPGVVNEKMNLYLL